MSIKHILIKKFTKYKIPLSLLDNYEEFGIKKGKVYYQQNGIKEKFIKINTECGLRLHKDKDKKIRLQMINYNKNPTEKKFVKNIIKDTDSDFYNILYTNKLQIGGSGETNSGSGGSGGSGGLGGSGGSGGSALQKKISDILTGGEKNFLNTYYNITIRGETKTGFKSEYKKLIDNAVEFLLPKVLNKLINERN